jgi:hypothetical protein
MSNVVNLRRARKDKARADRKARADENAMKHGTPRAIRDLDAARREQADRRLDQHKRDGDE